MKRTKTPKHTLKLDGADFNLDHAASLSLADFQAAHAHLWPGRSEDERNSALASVHEKALAKVQPQTTKTATNGNTGGNAPKVPVAKSGPANSGSGGAGSNDSGKS